MFQRIRNAHYVWVIFVVAFITLLGAAGFRSALNAFRDAKSNGTFWLLWGLSLLVLDPMLHMKGWGFLAFMMFYGLDWVATQPAFIISGTCCLIAAYGVTRIDNSADRTRPSNISAQS